MSKSRSPVSSREIVNDAPASQEPSDLLGNAARQELFPYQREMESLFGEDFSSLQVRLGGAGPREASAWAEPETLWFEQTQPDRETVAHELSHVVQFRRHAGSPEQDTSSPEQAAEREADAVGAAAARGQPVSPRQAPQAAQMHKKKKRADVDWARTDKYNQAEVNNNRPDGQVDRQRPGVTLGQGDQRDDSFQIGIDDTPSYFGNGERRATLPKGAEVCVNPAEPRSIGGKTCVLVWAASRGAGWVPASALFDGTTSVGARLVSKLHGPAYEEWRPEDDNFKYADKRMQFRSAGPLKHDSPGVPAGTEEYVYPNQAIGNHTADHLMRQGGTVGRPEDDYFNVFMSLPQSDAAAVAHDVAQPGEHFWVVKVDGQMLKRSVDTFRERSTRKGRDLTFVFGYVGDEHGPNKRRRGWVAWPILQEA